VGKRAELPKADAFFGGGAEETATLDAKPPALLRTEAPMPLKDDELLTEVSSQKPRKRGASAEPAVDISDVTAPLDDLAPTSSEAAGDVEKVTLYLPPDIIKQLEVARVDLLVRYGTKVNRSQIATASLRQTLEELARRTAEGERLAEVLIRG